MLQFNVRVVVLLLVCGVSFQKHSELICSHQPIVALAGDDVIFPCHLEPPTNASLMKVEWIRPDLAQNYVYIYRDGHPVCYRQNPQYHHRTELFADQLENGNVSLKLFNVTRFDTGNYTCFLPLLQEEASIQLTVVSHEEESELISTNQPIIAVCGDTVILPCHLEPPIDSSSKIVVWTKPGLHPKYVHVHHQGRPVCLNQNPWYANRTALFVDELKNGNVSLILWTVEISDAGKYECNLPSIMKGAAVQLIVGAVSKPIIMVSSNNNGSVVLQCESEGWYPEPEVLWLDDEGHVLSVGPTNTSSSPDGFYNVSSRVTVEKRHSNNFTCRVQQKDINQTRETQICVTDDLFMVQSSFSWIWICIIILFIIALIIIISLIIKRKTEVAQQIGADYLTCWRTCIRSNQETVMQNSENRSGEPFRKLKAYALELVNAEKKELEDQGATEEGRESAAQQRELQEDDILDTQL